MVDGKLCDDPLHQLELRLVAVVTDTRATDSNNSATGLPSFLFFWVKLLKCTHTQQGIFDKMLAVMNTLMFTDRNKMEMKRSGFFVCGLKSLRKHPGNPEVVTCVSHVCHMCGHTAFSKLGGIVSI